MEHVTFLQGIWIWDLIWQKESHKKKIIHKQENHDFRYENYEKMEKERWTWEGEFPCYIQSSVEVSKLR